MKSIFIIVAILLIAWAAQAESKTFLYGDYYAGMSRENFKKTGPAICDEYPDDRMVCSRQDVKFADYEWTQFFEFKGTALSAVAFGQPLNTKIYDKMLTWLFQEDWLPFMGEANGKFVSLVGMFSSNNKEEVLQAGEKFNKILTGSPIAVIYFFKGSDIKKFNKSGAPVNPLDLPVASLGADKVARTMFITFETYDAIKLALFDR